MRILLINTKAAALPTDRNRLPYRAKPTVSLRTPGPPGQGENDLDIVTGAVFRLADGEIRPGEAAKRYIQEDCTWSAPTTGTRTA